MAYRKATIAAFATLSLGLGACEGMNTGDVIGSLGGGVGGAVLGSQIGGGTGRVAATAFGSLAGALAGQQLSRHLQGNDQTTAVQAEETAITRNEPIQWSSAESDRRGTIEPTRTFQNPGGQTCREYQHTVYIGGRAERANGTACQQPDGSWRIVS